MTTIEKPRLNAELSAHLAERGKVSSVARRIHADLDTSPRRPAHNPGPLSGARLEAVAYAVQLRGMSRGHRGAGEWVQRFEAKRTPAVSLSEALVNLAASTTPPRPAPAPKALTVAEQFAAIPKGDHRRRNAFMREHKTEISAHLRRVRA